MSSDDLVRRVLQLERQNHHLLDQVRQLRNTGGVSNSQGSRTAVLQATASIAGRTEASGVYTISHGPARLFDLVVGSAGTWELTAVKAGATERTVELGNLSDGPIAADQFLVCQTIQGAWMYNPVGDRSALAMSPSGGIPARSGTTSGSATVTLYTNTGGTLAATSPAITVTAYNQSLSAVAGSTYIHLKREYLSGTWLVDFEDCG